MRKASGIICASRIVCLIAVAFLRYVNDEVFMPVNLIMVLNLKLAVSRNLPTQFHNIVLKSIQDMKLGLKTR